MSQLVYATPNNKIQSQPGINYVTIVSATEVLATTGTQLIPFLAAPTGSLQVPGLFHIGLSTANNKIYIDSAGTYSVTVSVILQVEAGTVLDADTSIQLTQASSPNTPIILSRSRPGLMPTTNTTWSISNVSATFYAFPNDFFTVVVSNFGPQNIQVLQTKSVSPTPNTIVQIQKIY
jgi:hypothetical protein